MAIFSVTFLCVFATLLIFFKSWFPILKNLSFFFLLYSLSTTSIVTRSSFFDNDPSLNNIFLEFFLSSLIYDNKIFSFFYFSSTSLTFESIILSTELQLELFCSGPRVLNGASFRSIFDSMLLEAASWLKTAFLGD